MYKHTDNVFVTTLKSKANDEWKEDLEKSFGYANLCKAFTVF